MKLGLCTGFDNLELAAKIGFDYIECAFSILAAMPDEDYQRLLARKDAFPIPVSKANLFLPGDITPIGPDASERAQREYLDRAFGRAHAIGVKLVVFGSGRARKVPEGWSYARAWRQLTDFLDVAAEYALKYDVVIALEPLRSVECNLLNYVTEATALCGIVNHPYITVLGDTFHMLSGHEPLESLTKAGEKLSHVHISHTLPDMSKRILPRSGDGESYAEYINLLKDMNYAGDISIEAWGNDLEKEGRAAVECIKSLL